MRVRIAPSPTGYLHVGTARTALFNWLFAKKSGGQFILRIEDTDLERSNPKFEADIINGLKWLGLNWDEGPHRQSKRLNIYETYLQKLLAENKAYYCDCPQELLKKDRQEQLHKKEPPRYNGRCRGRNVSANQASLIRFRVDPEIISFNDMIRGEISFDTALIGDFAIAKNLRTSLYNFAVVIDDYEMRISHVIRGEDHIANTPKQIILQRALDFPQPEYAHLPLILDPDRSKMSKRFSAASIQEYRDQGYLAEAIVNFLALLGWHPKNEQEKMSPTEIIQQFDLKRIQKGGAMFDIQKLNWLNGEYLKEKDSEGMLSLLKNAAPPKFHWDDETVKKMIKVFQPRMQTLQDFFQLAKELELADYPKERLSWKTTSLTKTQDYLNWARTLLTDYPPENFSAAQLEKSIMPYANAEGRGEVLWPLRVALNGKEKSPGPFELLELLGKKEGLARIDAAIQKLNESF